MTPKGEYSDNHASNDARCELAILIYGMTASQQAKFRDRFTPGILDEDVENAIVFARRVARK
jgi:hypothetical protein